MLLPVNLNVQDRLCVVVGGGRVARRKCRKLVEHGARVRAVAPVFCEDAVWAEPGVELVRGSYERGGLAGAFLVIAATDDAVVNRQVGEDAAALGILQQQVDAPEACDFMLPATLRRGDVTVSFATDGVIPALAAVLKAEAERAYDDAYGAFCELVGQVKREAAWQALAGPQREAALERLAGAGLVELLRAGREDEAREKALQIVQGIAGEGRSCKGKVYLIGAGPGDPGLFTIKGAVCLRQAEVVLYDAIANPVLLELYCPRAERIDVSKRKGCCRQTQEEINALLIEHALAGRTVARLKGGDPLLFGRGGEEARALAERDIAYEFVPGVSCVTGVPTYAGIPVTDREYASSLGVYSIHKKGGYGLSDEEWRRMAQGPDTLVLLMGRTVVGVIAEKLVQFGREPETPVALITQGTLPTQTRALGTLGTIAQVVKSAQLEGPGLVVVGDVVRAIPTMDWFACRTIGDMGESAAEMAEAGARA